MVPRAMHLNLFVVVLVATSARVSAGQTGHAATWDSVATILQTSVTNAPGYNRFNFPRRDFQLRMGDVDLATSMASGAWAGFAGDGQRATMMGDLVLLARELGPVLRELARRDIEVTAIHNHLVGAEPQLAYVHFHAHGSAVQMARRLEPVLALTAIPRPVSPAAAQPLAIDTTSVFRALGPGRAQGAVAQVSLNLVPGRVTINGEPVVPALGYGTPINVQAVTTTRFVATGDFSVVAAQVDPVLDAMAEHGITAMALHIHMLHETPNIYYIHFWADGSPETVLQGLKATIEAARQAH